MHRSRTWGRGASGRPRRARMLAEVRPLESRLLLSATVPTSTTLAASTLAPIYGQAVTLTATVAVAPGSPAPTGGTVTFLDGRTALGSTPLADGSAALTIATLPVGAHALSAVYGGDGATYLGSTSMASPSSAIATYAGDGIPGNSGDGGPATAASLTQPDGLVVDAAGDLFIADPMRGGVREVKPDGTISTVTGAAGSPGDVGDLGDGGQATSALVVAYGLAVDAAGDLFIADEVDQDVREVRPDGIISTVAGDGHRGESGDGGPAASAMLNDPTGVAVDAAGDLFIADSEGNAIREVWPDGTIATIAGDGRAGHTGDGGPATSAALDQPRRLAVDAAGDLLVAEAGDIRMIAPTGLITTVAGDGTPGEGGIGGPATGAAVSYPLGLAVDARGDIFLPGADAPVVRRIASVAPLTVTVAPGATASATLTAVSASNASPLRGATTTLTADVYSSENGVTPTGTVSFRDGNILLGVVPLAAPRGIAAASLAVSDLAPGPHGIRAEYSGDGGDLPSTADPIPFTVRPDATATLVGSSTPAAYHGQPVTYTATVRVYDPGSGAPGGTVTFKDGGVAFGTVPVRTVAGVATASLTIPAPLSGPQSIEAFYNGDAGDLPSSYTAYPVTVVPVATSTAFAPSTDTPVVGKAVTLYAVVSAASPSTMAATGTVVFEDGGKPIGSATIGFLGNTLCAAYTTSALGVGPHAITAVYEGDAGDVASASSPAIVHVVSAATTTSLSISDPEPFGGTAETITATVRYASGAGVPSGMVAFAYGARVLAFVPVKVVGGVATATYTTPPLGTGWYTFGAVFGGAGGDLVSEASDAFFVGRSRTTIVVSAPSVPVVGQPTLTAFVSNGAADPAAAPTGTVTFWADGMDMGTAPLTTDARGVTSATLTTRGLVQGTYPIWATYNGDARDLTSYPKNPPTVVIGATPPKASALPTSSGVWSAALDALGAGQEAP